MPYALTALLAAMAATLWFLAATRASLTAKAFVSGVCAVSIAVGFVWPRWWLVGLLMQAFIVIGLSLYATATRTRRRDETR